MSRHVKCACEGSVGDTERHRSESCCPDQSSKSFLERVKSVSTIDDAKFSEDALVIWPSPDVQSGLDYEAMGEQLCQEYRTYGYLVIWFMDSSKYRRDTEMVMLQSYVCIEDA